MDDTKGQPNKVYQAKLDSSGRIVLPQPVRERLHLSVGDGVLVVEDRGSYRLETPEQALRHAQAYFTSLVPTGVSIVDELIAERRPEASRD